MDLAVTAASTSTEPSRRRAVIAAVSPLLLAWLFWLGMAGTRRGQHDVAEISGMSLYLTGTGACGPFAPLVVLGPRPVALWFAAAAVLWAGWLFVIARTRLGRAHWPWYAVASSIWLVLGTMLGVDAALTLGV